MKMYDEISKFNKEYVYEQYVRIVKPFKNYEKITKVKMLDAIYKVYDDPKNIIDICTTRELKYLKMVLDNKITFDDLIKAPKKYAILSEKYDWERETLSKKFLLDYDYYKISSIPEEIIDKVKNALNEINWVEKKKTDDLNELLVSYCKMQGTALLNIVCQFASEITETNPEKIWKHILNNKLFNYYVLIATKNIDGLGENVPLAIFQDYYDIVEELHEQRKEQGLAEDKKIDLRIFKMLFYNDFDLDNPKIKKLLNELDQLPLFGYSVLKLIRKYAMLNIGRDSLRGSIKSVPALKNVDLTKFFKTLDEAMDEMPSGALNGFTPNEAKEIKIKQMKIKIDKAKKYVRQDSACVSKKDAELFYKIYFALLEFTNQKYKINNKVKIYNHNGINPFEIVDIVDKFWKNKDTIISEFCLDNHYKFSKEELDITSEFKKGIRDVFIISKYEREYTAFMEKSKIYMVKGLKDNIDNIIPYNELPYVTVTSIIPFKGNLVYDGMLQGINVKMGCEFDEMVENEYNSMMKYYHL